MWQISLADLTSDVITALILIDVTKGERHVGGLHVRGDEVGEGEQKRAGPHQNHPHANEKGFPGAFPD